MALDDTSIAQHDGTGTPAAPDARGLRDGRDHGAVAKRRRRTARGRLRLLTLDALDQRTAAAMAANKLIADLTSDLGGEDAMSAGEQQLITRAALVGAIAADFETRWVDGQKVDLETYLGACNVQRRLLATLGLRRRAKQIGGTLAELLREDEKVRALRAQVFRKDATDAEIVGDQDATS